MAVKTVNVQGFDATMALGQTAQVRQTAKSGTQSFGEVLNKVSSKVADKNQQIAPKEGQKNPEADTNSEKTEGLEKNPKQNDSTQETNDSSDVTQENVDNVEEKDIPDKTLTVEETQEAPDEMTTEQIADALAHIICI